MQMIYIGTKYQHVEVMFRSQFVQVIPRLGKSNIHCEIFIQSTCPILTLVPLPVAYSEFENWQEAVLLMTIELRSRHIEQGVIN